ncbi:uncharacterized protein LOC111346559 isoform X2 [Stylophora pistillata]|uniref:uncharacterized protein LOC111346559 isoform X2 n=1 Tax=Stylophora pistillata TaxID=50429 RepID=UPI000C03BD0A|nr:uncharacterized protein LOC111346559 isoform X2 [Stylophora pistillata]
MATPFLFVSVAPVLVLFMIPTAVSLQCYECSNLPDVLGGTSCNLDNVKKLTCPPFFDRCMTMKYDMSIGIGASQSVELRNCSSSLACNPQSDFNACKLLGDVGVFFNCTMDCCQGELCNTGRSTTKPSTAPSSAVKGPALSLVNMLSALVLSKIVGFN